MVKIRTLKQVPKLYCKCQECETMFEIFRKRSKFCSPSCRTINNRKK